MTAPKPRAATHPSDLAGSDLAGVELTGSDLAGVELTGSDLAGVELTGSDLADFELAGSDLDLLGMTAPGAAPEVGDLAANALCGASAILAPGGPTAVPFDLCCVLTLVRAVGTDPGPAVCRALEMLDVDQPLVAESAP
jgi:hypothetical protein